jgi:Spy/CpxP family protein refolding chaperone
MTFCREAADLHALTRWLPIALAFASVLLVPTQGWAEPRPAASADPSSPAAKRGKVKERLKQIRSKALREQVGLDEATATRVEATFEKYRVERTKQRERLSRNRKTLAELVKSDSKDQAAYSRAIAEVRAAQQELFRLRSQQTDELSKILTPKQQAKLALTLEQLKRRLRAALRHAGGDGDRRKGSRKPGPRDDEDRFGF